MSIGKGIACFLSSCFNFIFKLNRCAICHSKTRRHMCAECIGIIDRGAQRIADEEDKRLLKMLKINSAGKK